jgi:hypothetical protein
MMRWVSFASGIAIALVAVGATDVVLSSQNSQAAPPKPAMVLVPDKSDEIVLDQINQRRETALRDKMKYEADYGQCVNKSKAKEDALTCLARWEAAASEYHKAEIEFTAEIERRDMDAIDVINRQLTSLTGRLARMQQGTSVVSAKEQAAVYQGSLDRLKVEIEAAKKNGMDPARLENLETQARYLAQAVENVEYAGMGLQSSEIRVRDAIATYRKLAGEREAILSESKSATLLARVQFQAAESLRLARRAEIDLRWPAPPPPCGRKEICGLCGPFESLEACLASSPTMGLEQCKGKYRISNACYTNAGECKRANPTLTDAQCVAIVKK